MMIQQIIRRVKTKQLFYRLISYFVILLILTVILMTVTYVVTNRGVRQQYEAKMQYNLERVSEIVDNQVEIARNLGVNFFTDDTIKRYFRPKKARDLELEAEQWRIPKLLSQNTSIFGRTIRDMYVFFQGDNQVYTSAGVYEADFFFQNICRYEKYTQEFWQEGIQNHMDFTILSPSAVSSMNTVSGDTVIPVIVTERISGTTAVFVANLSMEDIQDMLEVASVTEDNAYVVLDWEDHIFLDTRENGEREIPEEKILEAAFGEEIKKTIKQKGRKYWVFRCEGGSGWVYLSILSHSSVNRTLNNNLFLVLGIGSALLLMGFEMALLFAKKIYYPINQTVNILFKNRNEEIDEMDALQEGVKHLLDSEKDYEQVKKHYSKKYVEHSLQLAVSGMSILQKEKLLHLLSVHYGFQGNFYVCCTILFDFSIQFYRDVKETEQEEIIEKLRQILEALIESSHRCCIVSMQKGSYTCVANLEREEEVREICRDFQKLDRIFENDREYYTVAIGIGSICEGIGALHVSYNQAQYALQSRSQKEPFEMIAYDDLSVKRQVSFTFYDQRKIVNCIRAKNEDGLEQVVTEILSDNQKRGVSRKNMLELYQQIGAIGQRCLEEQGMNIEERESFGRMKAMFAERGENTDYETAKGMILEYLKEVLQVTGNRESDAGSKMAETIRQYVMENYAENLSLEQIGTDLGLSPKYMSRLFKQKTGKNLTDYINEVRISKAKEILITTNMKIGDISAMVGIESRATFLRVFKKMEGIAPNEYRMLKKQEEEQRKEQ